MAYKSIKGTVIKSIKVKVNKNFAERLTITEEMFSGKHDNLMGKLRASNNIGFPNFEYSTFLIMNIDTSAIIISANYILNIGERWIDPRINALAGMGRPINLPPPKFATEFISTLNHESLKIPHNTIKRATSILMYGIT